MIAILCPGQGSQTPGMLDAWLELDGVPERLDTLAEASGVDLRHLGTAADAEAIKDTSVAQPLIVAASLISLGALTARVGDQRTWASVTAGHSVGEYAAAVVAGVLTEVDALSLVGARGRAMASAAAATPTGMAAVVGGDPTEVMVAIADAGLDAANVNGGGQIVAAGALDGIARLKENAPARARVIPLAVAGAFHTEYMRSAVAVVEQAAVAFTPRDPDMHLLTNSTGGVVESGTEALKLMVRQIARQVSWEQCQVTLGELGVTAAIELAPAGALTGLARRTLPGVETVAIKTPADLDAAADLVARHSAAPSQEN